MSGSRSRKKAPVDPRVPPEVFRAELEEIGRRWQAAGTPERAERGQDVPPEKPSTQRPLVGLAFSGGGIRSATLNLGITQSLHRHRVFDHVDYLSTVSGGGYLGSSISTLMRKHGTEFPYKLDPPFPKPPPRGARAEDEETPAEAGGTDGARTESPYLTWVRNHSNYLAERGFLDYLRMIAVLVRGILVNFLTLLPLLLLAALFLGFAYGELLGEWSTVEGFFLSQEAHDVAFLTPLQEALGTTAPFVLTPLVALLALAYFLMFPIVTRLFKVVTFLKTEESGSDSSVRLRDRFERSYGGVLLAVAAVAVIEALPLLIHHFHQIENQGVRNWIATLGGGSSIAAMSGAGKLLSVLGKARQKLVMALVGLLGLILPLLVVLYVTEFLVYRGAGFDLDGAGFELAWWKLAALPVILAVGVVLAFLFGVRQVGWKESRWLLGLLVILLAVVAALYLTQDLFGDRGAWFFVFALAVEIWLFSWLSVDINLTSVHGFYRDRLASAYLVGADTEGDVAIEEDVNLQDLGREGSRAPYHLINVALNLQGSDDPGIRERNSDFFIFSKCWVGGNRTGYCRSEELERVFPQMDLATAMAISAAAASPNMGTATSAPLVAVMTLFNVRLGFWVPHPGRLVGWMEKRGGKGASGDGEPAGLMRQQQHLRERFRWRVRPRAFVEEMLSRLDERHDWVNLSDGGHIENLAVIELLRRRCRFIIAGDGEADPGLNFGGLATLIRYARIDLGTRIDIDLDELRLEPARVGLGSDLGIQFEGDRRSRGHWALGTIHYPDQDEPGYLLYLKSSFTGDEDEVVTEYRVRNPAFPHESTADQFFDEGQFEAYRALGQHIADGLFHPPKEKCHCRRETVGATPFEDLERWFDGLRGGGEEEEEAGAG